MTNHKLKYAKHIDNGEVVVQFWNEDILPFVGRLVSSIPEDQDPLDISHLPYYIIRLDHNGEKSIWYARDKDIKSIYPISKFI
ncbi:MAG: hypothetical protein AABX29_08105 [Nanoarchaeota archaeon]